MGHWPTEGEVNMTHTHTHKIVAANVLHTHFERRVRLNEGVDPEMQGIDQHNAKHGCQHRAPVRTKQGKAIRDWVNGQ
jgi:hypothetical protein